MIRIKRSHHRNEGFPEATKRIYTFRNLVKTIPDCEELAEFYESCVGYDDYVKGDWERLYEGKEIFQRWLDETNDGYIFTTLHELKRKSLSAFVDARQMVDREYEKYFNYVREEGIPTRMVQPMVAFFPSSDRKGSFIFLGKKGIHNPVGNTELIVRGVLPLGRDFKTIFAMMQIIQTKPVEYFDPKYIRLTTSHTELCKERGIKEPTYTKDEKEEIMNSLERLRQCTLVWKDKNGTQIIAGILSRVEKQEGNRTITIDIHMEFFRFFDRGYLKIDREIFYSLRGDIEILLYLLLAGDKGFNTFGVFGGKYGYDIFSVCERINLGKIGEPNKERMRHQIKKAVKRLHAKGAIRSYNKRLLADDKLMLFAPNKSTTHKLKINTP